MLDLDLSFKQACLDKGYPIMQDGALERVAREITSHHYHNLLEIGTCVGYSAITLSQLGISITTLERDMDRHLDAKANVKKRGLEKQIVCVYDDALCYIPSTTFDLILFDGAKAQNQAYLDYYAPYLNPGGMIIIDNMNFHALREAKNIPSKQLRRMMEKLDDFYYQVQSHPDFDVEFSDEGDGLCLLRLKNQDDYGRINKIRKGALQ